MALKEMPRRVRALLRIGKSTGKIREPEASISQLSFSLFGGRQRVLLFNNRVVAGVFDTPSLQGIKFNGGLKFGGHIRFGIDGLDWAFSHTGGAINAILRVNNELVV
jgi:hypothetical protein